MRTKVFRLRSIPSHGALQTRRNTREFRQSESDLVQKEMGLVVLAPPRRSQAQRDSRREPLSVSSCFLFYKIRISRDRTCSDNSFESIIWLRVSDGLHQNMVSMKFHRVGNAFQTKRSHLEVWTDATFAMCVCVCVRCIKVHIPRNLCSAFMIESCVCASDELQWKRKQRKWWTK